MSNLGYDEVARIESAEGFDRKAAESAVNEALERRMPFGTSFLECRNPGVLACEEIGHFAELQQAMDEVAEKLGVAVVCVADCEWTMDRGADEEATWIAFDIPSLPDDYRTDRRNRIEPTPMPAPAPSA